MTRVRASGLLFLGLVLGLAACASARHSASGSDRTGIDVLVVAPHPDDEVLIAGGVAARAVAEGRRVTVVVMTNGDFDCVHDGHARQRESLAGLAKLGVPADRVRFLGYPDGGLALLGKAPLSRRRLGRDGRCAEGDTTYGARKGQPAKYTRDAVVRDLVTLLDELRPADVFITHPVDTHPDHAATYALFRDALDHVSTAPRVHRAIVHAADCWPLGPQPAEPCPRDPVDPSRPTPSFTGRLSGYVPRERLRVPRGWSRSSRDNPKVSAIASHASQTRGTYESYLFSFARADEAFFPESFVRRSGRWVRSEAPAKALTVPLSIERGGATITVTNEGDGYVLAFAPGRAVELTKVSAHGESVRLQTWPLPHDLWTTRPTEYFELVFEWRGEDGPIAEISLRHGNALLGVTVDVHPHDVRAIDVSASPTARRAP